MITKSLFGKQIIVLISNENKMKFMEESSVHITHLNRVLKNIKSKAMMKFCMLGSDRYYYSH